MHRLANVAAFLGLAGLLQGCYELTAGRQMKADDAPEARVQPAGSGTLVVRGPARRSRVGLISLDSGERHLLQLESSCAFRSGSFAGPDVRGRYAYVCFNDEVVTRVPPPSGLGGLLVGPGAQREYEEYWRIDRHPPRSAFGHWLFDPVPTRIFVGDLQHPGERLFVERNPRLIEESLLALAPSSGELAWFEFDIDAQGRPQGLHLELQSLDGGAARAIPLGRVQLDLLGQQGPCLAWLGDEQHLLFKRDTRVHDSSVFVLDEPAWNGRPDSSPVLDPEGHEVRDLFGGIARNPWRTGFVLCVLDTRSGEWRDLGVGPFGWPTGRGDEVLASDGRQLWLIHAASGDREPLGEITPDSPLHAPWNDPLLPTVSILAVDGLEHVFVAQRASARAALPRDWASAMVLLPDKYGLQCVALDGGSAQPVVPLLTTGFLSLANGTLPAGMSRILGR